MIKTLNRFSSANALKISTIYWPPIQQYANYIPIFEYTHIIPFSLSLSRDGPYHIRILSLGQIKTPSFNHCLIQSQMKMLSNLFKNNYFVNCLLATSSRVHVLQELNNQYPYSKVQPLKSKCYYQLYRE